MRRTALCVLQEETKTRTRRPCAPNALILPVGSEVSEKTLHVVRQATWKLLCVEGGHHSVCRDDQRLLDRVLREVLGEEGIDNGRGEERDMWCCTYEIFLAFLVGVFLASRADLLYPGCFGSMLLARFASFAFSLGARSLASS